MNLGHRERIAEVIELRRENAELRRRLADAAPDEIDLRELEPVGGASPAEAGALSG